MSTSRQEEIIAVLWVIAALIAFGNGYAGWGWTFAIKGAIDTLQAIWMGVIEIISEGKQDITQAAPPNPPPA